MSGHRLVAFLAANAVAIGLVAVANWLGSTENGISQRRDELARVWLPAVLAMATLLSALVAAGLSQERQRAFLLRHFTLYAAAPLSLIAAHLAAPGQYGGLLRGIYVTLVLAALLHALEGLWRAEGLGDRRRAGLIGTIVLAANLMLIPPLMRGMFPTADEPHYLLTAQSLVLDGDVDLSNDYAGDRYRAFYPEGLPDPHGILVGSAIYPIRDLGLPVLIAPALAVAGRYGVLALLGAFAALLAVQLYLLLRDLAFDPRTALLATAAALLTHPLLTYATQIYPDVVIALLVVSALRLLGRDPSRRSLALASAFAGLLLFLSVRAWVLALALILIAGYRAWRAPTRARALTTVGMSFLAPLAPVALVNGLLFGLPIPGAGYWLIREQHDLLGLAPHLGALGLLFDRTFGLIGRAPVYLLAFAGIATLLRRARNGHGPLLAALAVAGLAHFAFVANLGYWHSHWSPPSRNLVAAAPLLVVALAGGIELMQRARPRWLWAPAAGAALAWSVLVTVAYTIRPRLRYNHPDVVAASGPDELWRFVASVTGIDLGPLFPSTLAPDLSTLVVGLLWIAAVVLITVSGMRARRVYPV